MKKHRASLSGVARNKGETPEAAHACEIDILERCLEIIEWDGKTQNDLYTAVCFKYMRGVR